MPNITGYLDGDTNVNTNGVYWQAQHGALKSQSYTGSNSGISNYGEVSHNNWINRLSINASWSNAIYGRSSTVQPASVLVLYIIKAK